MRRVLTFDDVCSCRAPPTRIAYGCARFSPARRSPGAQAPGRRARAERPGRCAGAERQPCVQAVRTLVGTGEGCLGTRVCTNSGLFPLLVIIQGRAVFSLGILGFCLEGASKRAYQRGPFLEGLSEGPFLRGQSKVALPSGLSFGGLSFQRKTEVYPRAVSWEPFLEGPSTSPF